MNGGRVSVWTAPGVIVFLALMLHLPQRTGLRHGGGKRVCLCTCSYQVSASGVCFQWPHGQFGPTPPMPTHTMAARTGTAPLSTPAPPPGFTYPTGRRTLVSALGSRSLTRQPARSSRATSATSPGLDGIGPPTRQDVERGG